MLRVTEDWDEQTITWNAQPASTTADQVSVPAPATTTSDFEIYVTNLVRIMNDGQSNHGFLWILQNEQKYRSVFAASSDFFDPQSHPKLEVTYTPMKKYFYLKDHLGNIRVTVDENGEVKGYNDYYQFGLRMPGRSMNTALNYALYKYSSKELDEENGINWYYFGARYYDPAIGRWLSVDPLADAYPSLSPFNYALNNPLRYIDPDGKDPLFNIYNDMVLNQYNQFVVYINDRIQKYMPKVLDFTASVSGYASLKFPMLALVSFSAKMVSGKLKMTNPYYKKQDAYGDFAGAAAGLINPIAGELTDIAVDKYSTTTKKINPSYNIHSKPNGSGSNENNNQKEEKKNSRDDTNENNELVPLPAHDTTSKYTATMRDLLGIKD